MPKRNPGVNAIIYSARIKQTMNAERDRLNRVPARGIADDARGSRSVHCR